MLGERQGAGWSGGQQTCMSSVPSDGQCWGTESAGFETAQTGDKGWPQLSGGWQFTYRLLRLLKWFHFRAGLPGDLQNPKPALEGLNEKAEDWNGDGEEAQDGGCERARHASQAGGRAWAAWARESARLFQLWGDKQSTWTGA